MYMDYVFEWVATDKLHKVAEVLESKEVEVDAKDDSGVTLLSCAVMNKREKMVVLLLRYGANPNALDEGTGTCALYWACRYGMSTVVRELLRGGAVVRYKAGSEFELMEATCSGQFFGDVVKILHENGLDTAAVSEYVVMHGGVRGAEVLEELKVEGWKEGAMREAAKRGDVEVIQWLLGKGVAVDSRDADGNSALHMACRYDQLAAAEELVRRGADVNLINSASRSVLDLSYHHPSIHTFLLEHNATFNSVDYKRLDDIVRAL